MATAIGEHSPNKPVINEFIHGILSISSGIQVIIREVIKLNISLNLLSFFRSTKVWKELQAPVDKLPEARHQKRKF